MANNHEQWLKEQGARVIASRPLYRAFVDPLMQYTASEINELTFQTRQEQLYQIEVSSPILQRWRSYADRLQHIIDDADRYDKTPVGIRVEQRQRHQELLEENPMYKQAWDEFQQIRALMGEDPLWP